jgi:hypothetical protein
MAGMPRESPDHWIERHVALGLVVTLGSQMEETLRECFWQLDGGEYSDILAAGQDVAWLIQYCRILSDANPQIAQADKDAIKDALALCDRASQLRNELIHGQYVWVRDWGDILRSRRRKPVVAETWTLAKVQGVWLELHEAADQFAQAVLDAVGPRIRPRLLEYVDRDGKPWPF